MTRTPEPTPQDNAEIELDWRTIAKLAGEHGVRYRTNTSFAKFLAAIRSLSSSRGEVR